VNSEEIIKRPKAFSSGIGKYIKPDIKNNLKRINLEKVGCFLFETFSRRLIINEKYFSKTNLRERVEI
jgi:hypothetical protein